MQDPQTASPWSPIFSRSRISVLTRKCPTSFFSGHAVLHKTRSYPNCCEDLVVKFSFPQRFVMAAVLERPQDLGPGLAKCPSDLTWTRPFYRCCLLLLVSSSYFIIYPFFRFLCFLTFLPVFSILSAFACRRGWLFHAGVCRWAVSVDLAILQFASPQINWISWSVFEDTSTPVVYASIGNRHVHE